MSFNRSFVEFQFLLHALDGLNSMVASLNNLVTVNEAGGEEIDCGLYPECLVLQLDVGKGGSHGVETHKTTHTEGGWEKTSH